MSQGRKRAVSSGDLRASSHFKQTRREKCEAFTPPKCILCDKEINGIVTCFDHLSSSKHLKKVGGVCICGNSCPKKDTTIESVLVCPGHRSRLCELGFDVDAFDAAVASGVVSASRIAKTDGAREAAEALPKDPNWLVRESHCFALWDGRCQNPSVSIPLTHAAPLQESMMRLTLNQKPPSFVAPKALPVTLPAKENNERTEKWPFSPGAVPRAVAAAIKSEENLDDIDLISGPSFIRVLCGQRHDLGKCYFAQKVGHVLLVQQIPQRETSDMSDATFQTEGICCGERDSHTAYVSINQFRVGRYKIMASSQVDGFSRETNSAIKIQTSIKASIPKMRELLQISINGSSHIAKFKLSEDKHRLESLRMFSIEELLLHHHESWIYAGQRFKHVLHLILNADAVLRAVDRPVQITFGSDKLPMFTEAPAGSMVVPNDLEEYLSSS